jgi:transposase-like protein
VVQMYRKGESIRAIAKAIGCSYGKIHTTLHNSGTKIRKRGGSCRSRESH